MIAIEKPVPDHVMYVARDLDAAIADLEARTGVRAGYGGEHAGMGTHNALLSFGHRCYLEILAPTGPDSPALAEGGLLNGLEDPRLFMWAVSCADITGVSERAKLSGYDAGVVVDMQREQPGGATLRWKLSVGGADVAGSVVPFCIQWLDEPHPSETAPGGCSLLALRAEHPEPDRIEAALSALQVDLPVERAASAALVLTLDTPRGSVTLR